MTSPANPIEQEFIELEQQWNNAIQQQDMEQMSHFMAIGTQGLPLQIVPRENWLTVLASYYISTFTLDDIHVHVYGDTAIVLMLYTQQATIRGQDRSGHFVLTDVWIKKSHGWRVVERHSSRPEPQALRRPS